LERRSEGIPLHGGSDRRKAVYNWENKPIVAFANSSNDEQNDMFLLEYWKSM